MAFKIRKRLCWLLGHDWVKACGTEIIRGVLIQHFKCVYCGKTLRVEKKFPKIK